MHTALPRCPFLTTAMVHTRCGSRLRPRVRFSTLEQKEQASVPDLVTEPVPEEPQGFRSYQTRMGPWAPSPVPQRRSRKAQPISGPVHQVQGSPYPLSLSRRLPRQQQRQPHRPSYRLPRGLGDRCSLGPPIPGNVGLHAKDFHGESYYDVPELIADPRFRDSMYSAVYDAAAVLLSPGSATVLPFHDFSGSVESARAPFQYR